MINTGKFAALAIMSLLAFNPALAEDKSAAMVNGVSILSHASICSSKGPPHKASRTARIAQNGSMKSSTGNYWRRKR